MGAWPFYLCWEETDACDITASISKALSGARRGSTRSSSADGLRGASLHGVSSDAGEAESPVAWFTSNIKSHYREHYRPISGITITAIQLLPIDTMTAWRVCTRATVGLGSDTLNKGARAQWTPEERAR